MLNEDKIISDKMKKISLYCRYATYMKSFTPLNFSDTMNNHWLTYIVGLVLIQGHMAFSPIPPPEFELEEFNDEWEEFDRMLRDPAYRLPTTTEPLHYNVLLTPYFETEDNDTVPFTFDGQVTVYLSPTEANVTEIVMHCHDLTISTLTVEFEGTDGITVITPTNTNYECEMPYAFLRIPVTQALVQGTEYIVRATFQGNLQTDMRGFYRSWYIDSMGTKRWMGTTQFQPGHARKAFPCYDEPAFKATFDITINREADFSPTISNMPISTTNIITTTGRVAETFYTTPKTSTYLLAFIVSHYVNIAPNNDTERPFDTYARDNAGITGDWSLDVGQRLLLEMENYTQFPYYTMAENLDMKQAAIPDFSAGAMENWGLLTYREANILYHPFHSNHFYKQRVANIVAHEIAHMWFGNLVTCAWWDNLWLNEGFARFYQYFLTARVEPDLGYETRFITEQVHQALLADSIDSAHALTNDVNNPTTVSAHFSSITYAKGASVIRMTQHLLEESTFIKALRNYLLDRQYDVSEPHHLFEALDRAAIEEGALNSYNGITIDAYFRTWIEQAGYPLLTVNIDQSTGQMIVTQARWERTTGVSNIPSRPWHIPITWTRGGAPDFENLKPSTMLTGQSHALVRGSTGREWVVFNKQQSGFYRVNYDDTNWDLLTLALRGEERTTIHEYNRAQIVDDLFVLARSSVMTYTRAFNILSFLEFEDQYAPWLAAITGFNFALRRVAHDADLLRAMKDQIIILSTAVTARLGYAEIENEPFLDGLQRMYVLELLCKVGHEDCIAAGIQNFQNWRNLTEGTENNIPGNMRPWVYCTGLREGNAEDFTFFWNKYLEEDLANEKVVMLQTAGCTSDQSSLEAYLNAIVSGSDDIREQDYATALTSAVTGNDYNPMRVFYWLQNNVQQTTATLGSVATPLSYIAARLTAEADISEFEAWVELNRDMIGESSYNTGINGASSARANLEWSANRVGEMNDYFETGYNEPTFEDSLEEESEEEEEVKESEEVGEPDSGNIAALNYVTLIVMLTISFVS